jgi:CSLREA domain-containing protein
VRWVRRLTVVVLTALAAAPAAHAATIPVTTTADGVANEGLCSLREAVSAAGVTVIDTLRGDRAFDVFQGSSLALEALTVLRAAQRPAAQAGRSATRARSSSCARASRATPPAMAQTPRAGRCRRGDLERRPGEPVGRDRRRPLPRQRHRDGHPGGRVRPVLVGSASGGHGGAIALDSGSAEISATTFGRNRAGDGGPGSTTGGMFGAVQGGQVSASILADAAPACAAAGSRDEGTPGSRPSP